MSDEPYELAGTSKARRLLRESERALWDVLTALEMMRERMEAGATLPPAEMQRTVLALGTTRSKLLDEVRKNERQIFFENGLLADAPLDFDLIRDEIGGQLDRLRAARDAGELS